jgi:hypothetical protein
MVGSGNRYSGKLVIADFELIKRLTAVTRRFCAPGD